MYRIHNESSIQIAARFDLEALNGNITLILHSAGGASRPGLMPRNADYAEALELLLSRLGTLGATITDAYVDSTAVARLNLEERRLNLHDFSYPIVLKSVKNYNSLRRALTGAQKPIGRSPSNTAPGGNERKRIRLCVDAPNFSPSPGSLARLALILSQPQMPGVPSGGQGYSFDLESKLAVEKAAMEAAAEHYRDCGWDVEDVSASRSYDLHCTREGKALRVEVKGSTRPYAAVLLTPNEVAHALAHVQDMALFVLSGLTIERSGDSVVAKGGAVTIIQPWVLDPERLSATGYSYALDG